MIFIENANETEKKQKQKDERETAIEKANIEKQKSISKISEFNCFEPGFVSVIM